MWVCAPEVHFMHQSPRAQLPPSALTHCLSKCLGNECVPGRSKCLRCSCRCSWPCCGAVSGWGWPGGALGLGCWGPGWACSLNLCLPHRVAGSGLIQATGAGVRDGARRPVRGRAMLHLLPLQRMESHHPSLRLLVQRPDPQAQSASGSIESVMPSNHLVLCHPLLLLPSIFPSIGVFSNESALCIIFVINNFKRHIQNTGNLRHVFRFSDLPTFLTMGSTACLESVNGS